MPPLRPLRVLALCGYSQNATMFAKITRTALLNVAGDLTWEPLPDEMQKYQAAPMDDTPRKHKPLGRIQKATPSAEFTFLDPTVLLPPERLSRGQLRDVEKWGAEDPNPRSWWRHMNGDYIKFDDMVRYLHEYVVAEGPFDGVLGFSQGAAVTCALTSLMEKPGLHPDFTPHPNVKPFKFAVAVGGFVLRAKKGDFKKYYPIKTPVLNIIGRRDVVIPPQITLDLARHCINTRVEYHNGNHVVPDGPEWAAFFKAFFATMAEGGSLQDVPPLETFEQEKARL